MRAVSENTNATEKRPTAKFDWICEKNAPKE